VLLADRRGRYPGDITFPRFWEINFMNQPDFQIIRRSGNTFSLFLTSLILILSACISFAAGTGIAKEAKSPFLDERMADNGALTVRLDASIYELLSTAVESPNMEIPLTGTQRVVLELKKFNITSSKTRFVIGSPNGDIPMSPSEIVYLGGHISGEPNSQAYLAFSSKGMGSGYITLASGETYFVSQTPEEAAKGWNGRLAIGKEMNAIDLPEGVNFCGVASPESPVSLPVSQMCQTLPPGNRLANMAIEADQKFCEIFSTTELAGDYIMMVVGAVNNIYLRDLKLQLLVQFVRLWPDGYEPFSASDIAGFRDYWIYNEDPSPYNYITMFSGRRNLSYGGISYVGGTCSGQAVYSIFGYLNGSFPNPCETPNLGNWDVIVVAHEMGHASGAYHTWDYYPKIDSCYQGFPTRGTIMSYCHSWAGYVTNTDLFMHRRIEQHIEDELSYGGCMPFDCNENGISDAVDISEGRSLDLNYDGIPDECQDCNGNSILDPTDIANGTPDIDLDGIPDICETDCNGNNIPDHYEIFNGLISDEDGNDIPDVCDPDCNNNGIADFKDISNGTSEDYDRNNVPDECQDCNNNGRSDWLDLQRERNLFVADITGDVIREYHWLSGYPIRNIGAGVINDPYDLIFGRDNQLYVCNYGTNSIVRINVDSNTASTFVATGSGGLSGPTSLVLGPNGNLFVASRGTSSIIQYNGTTGALIGTFVASGSGGLVQPYGLTFGPNGDLFVTSATNAVMEYSGTDGSFVKIFVAAGSGSLSSPRGLAFMLDGNLLVNSRGNDRVLQYDGTSGGYTKIFNDDSDPVQPWGIRIGPNGNVFVANSAISGDLGYTVILQYMPVGRYYMRYVRGANDWLENPSGIAFRPVSHYDCNDNYQLDACDIALGLLPDLNNNGIPDDCDGADYDNDGIINSSDNCPFTSNSNQSDVDGDGVGDVCDNCPNVSNPDQLDTDHNGVGDVCQFLCGDANGDDKVNLLDVSFIINHLYRGGPAPNPLKAADVDNNTKINLLDVSRIINFLYRSGLPLVCPS
jgi:hypothetical protein